MSFYLEDIRAQVAALIQDDKPFLIFQERELFIGDAIRQYNWDKPYQIVKDIAATGVQDYALPTDYQKGFSDILSVEAPAGEPSPFYIDKDDDWYIYEDPTKSSGSQLRLKFRITTPVSGTVIRIILETPHTITLSTDPAPISTLSQNDFMAVNYLSACLCLTSMANKFNQTLNSTLGADTVDYGARAQNYLFNADKFRNLYKTMAGTEGENITAGQSQTRVHVKFPYGQDLLFHPARTR